MALARIIAPQGVMNTELKSRLVKEGARALKAALAVSEIADDGCARLHIAVSRRLQGAGVTEGVAAIVQSDEAVTLCGVEPLHGSNRHRFSFKNKTAAARR